MNDLKIKLSFTPDILFCYRLVVKIPKYLNSSYVIVVNMVSKKGFIKGGLAALVGGLMLNHAVQNTQLTPYELNYKGPETAVVEGRGMSTYGHEWYDGEKKNVRITPAKANVNMAQTFQDMYNRHPYSLEKAAMKILNGGEDWTNVRQGEPVKLAVFDNYTK